MIAPFPIYVDEIGPDGVKATVSNVHTVAYNIRTMTLDMPASNLGRIITATAGLYVFPIGRFVCLVLKGASGMILLDMAGADDLARKMAEKLGPGLEDKFLAAYENVVSHPEKHGRFCWVVGGPPTSLPTRGGWIR